MRRERIWAGLAVLTLVLGCAGGGQKKDAKPKAQTKKVPEYANKKYADNLLIEKDGIDFAHSFDCPGAYQNKIKDRTEDTHGRLRSYTQMVKCSVSNEIHSLIYFEISYNEKGQKSGYKMELSCSKTGEEYKLAVEDIGYDYSWGVQSYNILIGTDTLVYPAPEGKNK